ncbi:hypothetical protein [Streptomyces sp. C]|uniref:hypothetical protein n=1 Tax=Streptomyces sp. C TaxID=253839 RepID=UPI0001B536AA|nr:hypothetical protein [Streptomyces sp. C]
MPSDPPKPVDGCEKCAELAAKRTARFQAGDRSGESDCNVYLRRHLAASHAGVRA